MIGLLSVYKFIFHRLKTIFVIKMALSAIFLKKAVYSKFSLLSSSNSDPTLVCNSIV